MSSLTSRRQLFQSASALGLLSMVSGCPHPTVVLTVAPRELLVDTGLPATDLEKTLWRLRAADFSDGELYVQRRFRRQLVCQGGRADFSSTSSAGLALRAVKDGAEVDTAIGKIDAPTLNKLLERVGVPPPPPPDSSLESSEPPPASTDAASGSLVSGEDHASPLRAPTVAEVGAVHVDLGHGLADGESLRSTFSITEDSVLVATFGGHLTRRTVVSAHLEASLTRGDRSATVRSDLLDLLGPTGEPARAALLGQLRGTLMAASATPPPGPIPVVLHAGGGAQWLAHSTWDPSSPISITEGPLDRFGAADDTGFSPGEAPWAEDRPSTRFRARFDDDLVSHPRGLVLAADKTVSADQLVEAFEDGLRIARLEGPAVRVDGGVVLSVAEGWWHRPDHPPAAVPPHTRIWLPTQHASAVTAVGDDAITVAQESSTGPLLEATHPTLQLTGARVEVPHV